MSALQHLLSTYQARLEAVPAQVDGRPVVVHTGADVPREVLGAAGFVPFRLSGRPGSTGTADPYCGPGIDRVAVSRLARLLDGDADAAAGLVLSADNEGSVRLFLYLREILRLEPRDHLPPLTFLDLLHLRQRSSAVYNRTRLDALIEDVGQWAGRPVSDAGLRAAAATQDQVRTLIRAVGTQLRSAPGGPRLTGAQALAVIGASFVSAPERWCSTVTDLLQEAAALPVHEGTRVFLTGCDHDHTRVYDLVESLGAIVVGEDHDWGAPAGAGSVGTAYDIRSALVRTRAQGAPASAGHSAAARAAQTVRMALAGGADLVIAWTRPFDDAPPWDVPLQRLALQDAGIPLVVVPAQPYGSEDNHQMRTFLEPVLRDPQRTAVAQPR